MASLYVMRATGRPVMAVTVDHALRPEAAAEAAQVAKVCAELAVPHQILRWDHGTIAGNLQDQARQARYGLIGTWARGQGITHIVLGHTADDQAETFLMGLGRGAGLDGLSGMRPQWQTEGVTFLRPFLGYARAVLRRYLTRQGGGWIDDPSNENTRFTRVRARQVIAALAPLGIDLARLNTVIGHLATAQTALENVTQTAAARLMQAEAGGVTFRRDLWTQEPAEIQRRLLVLALRQVSGAPYAPRAVSVQRVLAAVGSGRDVTLWGCRFRVKPELLHLTREPRAVAGITCATTALWDGRWQVSGPHAPDLTLRALGAEGLRLCKSWRESGYSRDVLLVSPAVWRGNALVSAPLAGFGPDWHARIVAHCANL